MQGASGTARVDGRSQDGPGLDRRRGGGHGRGRVRGGDRGAEAQGECSTAGGGRGLLLSSVLCMTPQLILRAKRDQLRQARANYARRNTRGTVGGADGPPGVYKYIIYIYIYISLRAAFVHLKCLAPRYNIYGPI